MALLLALSLALGVSAPEAKLEPPKRPLAPPRQIKVPGREADRSVLSNPQISLDGKKVFVAWLPRPGSAVKQGLDAQAIPFGPDGEAATVHFPVQVNGSPVKLLLSRNDKYLAVLSMGELWIAELGDKSEPHRLYPPAQGDAPLGPSLSQAAFATESTWILVESPKGWGRVSVKGEFSSLPLPVIDLSNGSMDMSADGFHAVFVKTQKGEGYLNGSHVLATNITTDFTQGLDIEHLYTEVLFLPDGHPLGKEAGGQLWLLRPKSRLAYFTPPAVQRGASIDGYAINFPATRLAWVLTSGLAGKKPSAQLWIAGAPPTPQPPNSEKQDGD